MNKRFCDSGLPDAGAEILQAIVDRAEVGATAARFARALDARDWALLRSCFPDEVEADYLGLTLDRPRQFKADDFVALLRCLIEGSAALSHVSGNPTVDVNGDEATCTSYYLTHSDPRKTGPRTNPPSACGYHRQSLTRTGRGWKIRRITARLGGSSGQW